MITACLLELDPQVSGQVTFIYRALFTIQIVSKQLRSDRRKQWCKQAMTSSYYQTLDIHLLLLFSYCSLPWQKKGKARDYADVAFL